MVSAIPAIGLLAVLVMGGHWSNFSGVIWAVWGVTAVASFLVAATPIGILAWYPADGAVAEAPDDTEAAAAPAGDDLEDVAEEEAFEDEELADSDEFADEAVADDEDQMFDEGYDEDYDDDEDYV
jgi:hypothetical protein